MMTTPETGFASINGAQIHFEQAGAGHPLVLLHGLGLNLHLWDDQFASFANHYHVIRYDLRGFGQSMPATSSPFSHVEDLKGLLEHFRIGRAHVLGLSLGGRIALDFALMYPELLDRLVLVDAALGGYRFADDWYAQMATIMQHGKDSNVTEAKHLWLAHPLFDSIRAQNRNKQRFEQIASSDPGWHWLHQGLEQSISPSAAKRLHEIKAPTLVLVGEHDLPDFQAIADLLQANIAHAKKEVLAGAGHMANMEAPEQFKETVLRFLAGQ